MNCCKKCECASFLLNALDEPDHCCYSLLSPRRLEHLMSSKRRQNSVFKMFVFDYFIFKLEFQFNTFYMADSFILLNLLFNVYAMLNLRCKLYLLTFKMVQLGQQTNYFPTKTMFLCNHTHKHI